MASDRVIVIVRNWFKIDFEGKPMNDYFPNQIKEKYFEAMCIYTKILKPPFSVLQKRRLLLVTFVDESYLQDSTKERCKQNVNATIDLLANIRVYHSH